MSIAQDMVDGKCCSLCCAEFVDGNKQPMEHGYPVVCKECWKGLTKKEREMYQLATENTRQW